MSTTLEAACPKCGRARSPSERDFGRCGSLLRIESARSDSAHSAWAALALWKTLDGGFTSSKLERGLYGTVGWYLVGKNVLLCVGLITSSGARPLRGRTDRAARRTTTAALPTTCSALVSRAWRCS